MPQSKALGNIVRAVQGSAVVKSNIYDAIILGAGGAGLMCALTAGQRGRRVLVIDHASGPGKKILISGGGRCNFTNVNATTTRAQERYLSINPHFAKSALGRYTPQDFIELVEQHRIAFHEKTLGQLFCNGSARQIVEMLMDECDRSVSSGGRVDFAFNAPVADVSHSGGVYRVSYNRVNASATSLVIATGGPSIPKMGATAFAYDLARQFGLKIVEPRPALVPLTLGGADVLFRELSGVSAEVVARHNKTAFREAALFTHRGLSGPAILQISSYWRPGDSIEIDFLPDETADELLLSEKRARPKATLRSTLDRLLPARLAEALAGKVGLPVIEYNFYANRLIEGYKEEIGRGGAGYTAYDYEISKNLPPRDGVGTHTRAEQMKRAEGFLKAVIPEAEKANVRLALHPNDPPVPLSRGSEQIMATFEHWKQYLSLVKSPYNGMTFDCGVSREMGEDPVAVCRYLGERDCINHVHYRNVVVRKPYVDYT
ncbi:MAG: aminoacetone oxidase family FAD-binding enzyme, partial [Sphingomonadaceae bacterium]|nr:aminoacetone oxidase family FAD-binding enzyme [Sphingomonadaceae bacterium]